MGIAHFALFQFLGGASTFEPRRPPQRYEVVRQIVRGPIVIIRLRRL